MDPAGIGSNTHILVQKQASLLGVCAWSASPNKLVWANPRHEGQDFTTSTVKCSQQVKDESFPPLQCTGRAFAKAGSPDPLPWSTLLLPTPHRALNKPLSLEQGKGNPSLSQISLHKHLTNLVICQERPSPNPPASSQGPHCPQTPFPPCPHL